MTQNQRNVHYIHTNLLVLVKIMLKLNDKCVLYYMARPHWITDVSSCHELISHKHFNRI